MPTLITYIGKRPTYNDVLYGTGDWKQGETKPVHDETARKMLRHVDQYKGEAEVVGKPKEEPKQPEGEAPETELEVKTEGEAEVVGKPKEKTDDDKSEDDLQQARDSVAHMGKDALIEYAQVHFRQTIDKRSSVESARAKVIGLIDQYGLN